MGFDEKTIEQVWGNGRGVSDRPAAEWRKDECGAWLQRAQYGNALSEYGWKIEKISPGGPDTIDNLRPFHIRNTYDVANGKPHCEVTADREKIAPTQHIDLPHNREV